MHRLPGLIDRLFGGQQNGNLVVELYRLGRFRRSDLRIDNIAQRLGPDQSRREAKLRATRPRWLSLPV